MLHFRFKVAMINESQNLNQFLKDLLRRSDGWILIVGILSCVVLFLGNFYQYSVFPKNLQTNKWLMLWGLLPAILLFVHIRIRQLLHSETIVATICHAAVILTMVIFLALKNMELI